MFFAATSHSLGREKAAERDLVFAPLFPTHNHAFDVQQIQYALPLLESEAIDSPCQLRTLGINGFDVRRIRRVLLNPLG